MNDLNSVNSHNIPLVAIVGRPNVGKSTLFNRFISKRRAITDSMPGVTRDPIEHIWDVDDHRIKLVDTGGVKLEREGFDSQVSKKSYEVIQKADCIVLLLDVNVVTPEDEELIESLRPFKDKMLVAINKVDTEKKNDHVYEFYSYGLERLFPISAAHGLGCEELIEGILEFLPEPGDVEQDESSKSIRLAVLGKPNTGKSTLLNRLTDKELSIVSDIPGTTRDVIEGEFMYRDTRYTVLDTAGIRRKNKVTENVEYYSVNRAIKTIDEADVVLLMIDSVEGLTDQDKKIANLIVKKGKGIIVVLNKWDLMENMGNQLEAVKDRIAFLFPILEFAPVVPISALQAEGFEDLLKQVYLVHKELQKRVDTSVLNKALQRWVDRNPPPRWRKGQYKVRYMTQVSAKPVEFAVFVSRTKGFPEFYVRFLQNNIRKEIGFSNVPITLHIRG